MSLHNLQSHLACRYTEMWVLIWNIFCKSFLKIPIYYQEKKPVYFCYRACQLCVILSQSWQCEKCFLLFLLSFPCTLLWIRKVQLIGHYHKFCFASSIAIYIVSIIFVILFRHSFSLYINWCKQKSNYR